MEKYFFLKTFILLTCLTVFISCNPGNDQENDEIDGDHVMLVDSDHVMLERGEYLATIGVCSACHTAPKVNSTIPEFGSPEFEEELHRRADPDWVSHLDHTKEMAGGVPFIMRFSSTQGGVVYSRNITPDKETGLGNWTDKEIANVIKTGKRKDGTSLFLFAPHTFFKNLAEEDVFALVTYLKSLKPIKNKILERELPFPAQPATDVSTREKPPFGDNEENAKYLLSAIVGCAECHSSHKEGELNEFVGGDPADPFIGVFRYGPDLPLRQGEKGFANFPYPGYGILYGGNLTRFGKGGDLEDTSIEQMVAAVRNGVSVTTDNYGRPNPLGHVMMWQYYSHMSDADVLAICKYIKNLNYVEHTVDKKLTFYGTNWELAFKQVFGEYPSENDKKIFGKD